MKWHPDFRHLDSKNSVVDVVFGLARFGSSMMVDHKAEYNINDAIRVEMSEIRMPFHDLVDVINQEFEGFIMPGSDTDVGLLVPFQPSWINDHAKMKKVGSCKQMEIFHNLVMTEI
jgi:hypothetical protein